MTTELTGGCTCGAVRYRLASPPMFVNCCHCAWCQTETGSAFVLNALIETDRLEVSGAPEPAMTPSESGKGQEIVRCPQCRVALWSHYASHRRTLAFVRVGTLDDPGACPPKAHIFVRSKLPWVLIPEDQPAFEIYYDLPTQWPAESVRRREALSA